MNATTHPSQRLLTLPEVCEYFKIKDASVLRRALREEKLYGIKRGRDWFVTYNDVLAWKRHSKGKRGRPKSR